jgi:hypothetical protein
LVRIKSEHNLNEEENALKSTTFHNLYFIVPRDNQQPKKDKSYNSKNFFTENFDDQEMEDAINKIKSNPNFDKSNSSPDNGKNPPLVQDPGSPNVVLNQDELSISFEESNVFNKVNTVFGNILV